MRDLIDILNKILTESQVDEAANLAAGEILSRSGRFEKFINHIKNKQPFYIKPFILYKQTFYNTKKNIYTL